MVLYSNEQPYPEAFYQQVKQVLENFYDFPYLNRHALAKGIQIARLRPSETDGQRLRRVFMAGIDDLKPLGDAETRTHQGRFHRLLLLRYVDANTMQEVARLLGISERQAYRDLKRAEENLAAALWARLGGDLASQFGEAQPIEEALPPPAGEPTAGELETLTLHMAPTGAQELVRHAYKAVERLAHQRGIALELLLPAETVQVYTDASLAQQVLIRILSHITQHAATQAVNIRLENSPQGLCFSFAFHHAGPQPFALPDGPLLETLLDRLEWQMALRPPDEAGCSRHEAGHSLHEAVAQTGELALTLTVPVQETILLVIDDNNALIELLRRYLTQTRCQVVGVNNGLQGLQMAQSIQPDAILLDVMMPTIDGWEILQRLHANPETSRIPVVICSVFNDHELARSLGASQTLGKPVRRDQLLALLEELHLV